MLEMASREAQLAENLIAKQRQSDVLLLEISELAAQLAETNHFDDEGFNSPIDWMRFNCHLTEKAAADRIPVGGAAVRTALEPLAQKSGAHDHRLLPQRYADALVELASAGKPANFQVTATTETLKSLAGAAAGEMEFSLPISSTSVQRMACDCSVTRVLLSQESMTIDVGRSKRVISNSLRKVLKIRDGHCRLPGCERPASWCDGHHLVHWIHGGETNLGNLVLLCRRHHRMVHEGGWQLIKTDQEIVVIAPTITFGFPRGPD